MESAWSGRGHADPEKSGWADTCFQNLESSSPLPSRTVRPSLGGLDPFFPWVQDTSPCCGHTLLRVNWWVPIGHLLAVIWMNRQNPHEVSLASLLKTQEHKEQYKQAPTHPSHPSWDLQAKPCCRNRAQSWASCHLRTRHPELKSHLSLCILPTRQTHVSQINRQP